MPTLVRGEDVYSIEQDKAQLIVRSGTRDAMKQRIRKFVAADKAAIALKRAIANKLEEGYVLTEAEIETAPAGAKVVDRELAIIENPNDEQAWAIYGDWLSDNGDPRGELIALESSGGDPDKIKRIEDENIFSWFGEELWERHEDLTCAFRGGFLVDVKLAIRFEADNVEFLPQLLALPAARFLNSLEVTAQLYDPDDFSEGARIYEPRNIEPFTGAFDETPALALRRFKYDATPYAPVQRGAKMIHKAPRLEELTLHGTGIDFGELAHEKLKRLTLVVPQLNEGPLVEQLETMKLPALQYLSLTVPNDDIPVEALTRALASGALKAVKLQGALNAGELLNELADSAFLPRLTRVDVVAGSIDDRALVTLLENAERFAHLDRLVFTGTAFAREAESRLRAALPNAVFGESAPLEDTLFYEPTME